ncbi:MAG TPA: NosD domain-containing protein, partial [Actinomycetota bacterium]|nr:NosD domain-containing protein [Actinomycetota bacterium]
RNGLERQWSQARVRRSPGARLVGNHLVPDSEGKNSIYVIESPASVVSGNRSGGGGSIELYEGCDDSAVEDNTFTGDAHIALFLGTRLRVTGNNLLTDGTKEKGGSITLLGTRQSLVARNRIEGEAVGAIALFAQQSGEQVQGADGNLVEENSIRGALYGIQIMGSSENRVRGNRLDSRRVGVLVYPYGEAVTPVPATRNIVEGNQVRADHFGTYIVNAAGNEFRRNEVRTNGVGMFDLRTEPTSGRQNRYAGNSLLENRMFGFVAWGTSPQVVANQFVGNGARGGPVAPSLDPLPALLGNLRGGLAFLPFNGFDPADWDDGDPQNDLASSPWVGGSYQENVFRDNARVDIYALDARAANAATLTLDNRFRGSTVRIRQDWFGLVRVEDEKGLPATGASIEIKNALGDSVGSYRSGDLGFVPAEPDPARPHGQAPEQGALGPWARFTEYIVDGTGRRQAATPHWLVARTPEDRGLARYSWDGLDNDRDGYHIARGRYQIARVRLGTGCASLDDLRGAIAEAAIAPGTVRRGLLERVDEARRLDAQRGPIVAAEALCGLIADLDAQAGHYVLASVAGDLSYCAREAADAMSIPLVCEKQ